MMLVGMMLAEMDMKRVKTLLDKTLVLLCVYETDRNWSNPVWGDLPVTGGSASERSDGNHRRYADPDHHGTAGMPSMTEMRITQPQ